SGFRGEYFTLFCACSASGMTGTDVRAGSCRYLLNQQTLIITGYSLSSYFADLVDIIIQKSQSGVFVKFFVNDIDSQESFEKLLRYKGRFLKIYNYKKQEDSMAALHAKVISVDQKKTLITSANLSYHGQQGNIELGMLAESKKIAKQVDGVFTELVFKKVFTEI
ncbi:phospholipase D-like domain-containing protein, partial [Roseburia yibonii]|uniref:phospholipase D-like domain-containing protein n=1 Tax=Roseburia yibonii TaxID=2763063 RepID=UPI001FAE5BCC